MFVGINLAPLAYFLPAATIDLTRSSGKWTGTTTPEGWPAGQDTSIVYCRFPITAKPTEYTLIVRSGALLAGKEIAGGVPFKSIGNNRFTFTASGDPNQGFTFRITPAGTGPIKIAIVRSDRVALYDKGEIFEPDFISVIKPASCLRFMDWARVNDPKPARYPQVDDASWMLGVPYAVQALLCNRLGAHMKMNVHNLMTPDEISSAVAEAKLNPGLSQSVEWSNEVWNFGFKVTEWANAQPGGYAPTYGTYSGKAALAVQAANSQARISLCSQFVQPSLMTKVLAAYDASGAPASMIGDLGIAPYIHPRPSQMEQIQAMAVAGDYNGLLALLEANRVEDSKYFSQWAKLAQSRNAALDLYEYNLSLYPKTPEQTALYEKVAHSDDGAAMIDRMLVDFAAVGGRYPCFFNSAGAGGKNGFWGLTPDYASPGYPTQQRWAQAAVKAPPPVVTPDPTPVPVPVPPTPTKAEILADIDALRAKVVAMG